MNEGSEDRETLRGVIHFYSETGTEGGYWAFQDERFISKNETRFCCTVCDAYWDKEARPEGPYVDEVREPGYCPPGTHDFRLDSEENWSYEGTYVLKDGDELTIYEADGTTVAWKGTVDLRHYDLFTESVSGMWIHADQNGIDRDVWAAWFFEQRPAELTRNARHGKEGGS